MVGIFIVGGQSSINIENGILNSIELVRGSNDVSPEKWVSFDESVTKVYGWTSKYVSESTYFVAYEFDIEDDNYKNGFRMYCYEVDISTKTIRSIIGNQHLEKKYRKMGFIE